MDALFQSIHTHLDALFQGFHVCVYCECFV